MEPAGPSRLQRAALLALVLVAWLFYWSFRLRGASGAVGLLVALALVAIIANAWEPVAWAARWTDAHAWGASLVLAACCVLAGGHVARARHVDPPFMDVDQVGPASWILAAVLFLAGTWQLLSGAHGLGATPSCAACGSPAAGPRCLTCGAALA
jgi:hypothetical protein